MSDSIVVVCPNCSAANRVPSNRLQEAPTCGRCKGAIFSSEPVDLDGATFDRHVASGRLPVLVDFWAPWCGPCKSMAPAYVAAASQLEPIMRVAKVDTEKNQALGARFNIRSIPTLVLFRDGAEVARQAGAMGESDIVRWAQANA